MAKTQIFTLFSICAASCAFTFLMWVRLMDQPTLNSGGFYRSVRSIIHTASCRLDVNDYHLVGVSSETVYLTRQDSSFIVKLDVTTAQKSTIPVAYPASIDHNSVMVDSPYFYILADQIPAIFSGRLANGEASIYMNSIYFRQAVPMSDSVTALVAVNGNENTLQKKITHVDKPLVYRDVIRKQLDGIFCTDGKLHYDGINDELLYLYKYRNEYLIIDGHTFRLKHNGHTIDTNKYAKIKTVRSNGTYSIVPNSLVVNGKSSVADSLLVVNSGVCADNENPQTFNKVYVLDVYNYKEDEYLYSFYVPKIAGQAPLDFRLSVNRNLFVLYTDRLITYQLGSW